MAATLDADIKKVAIEALVAVKLEQHLSVNRASLVTYDQVRREIQASIEARQPVRI